MQFGYRILQEAAYFPLYPLLSHVTAPLVGERYPRANRLMVAPCIAWTIILTRLLAGATFVV